MTHIIGISGKIGVGKSTVARMLLDWSVVSAWRDFGDELKREAAEQFNFPLNYAYSAEGKERIICHQDLPQGSMRVRHILQWWGEVRREQDPHYWVKKLIEWKLAHRPDVFVVGDVRYREEATWVQGQGGKLYRIMPYPGWQPGHGAKHKSETDLDSWDAWDQVFWPEYGELEQVAAEIAGHLKPQQGAAIGVKAQEMGE